MKKPRIANFSKIFGWFMEGEAAEQLPKSLLHHLVTLYSSACRISWRSVLGKVAKQFHGPINGSDEFAPRNGRPRF